MFVGNASFHTRVFNAGGPTNERRFLMPTPLGRGSPAKPASVELPWSLACIFVFGRQHREDVVVFRDRLLQMRQLPQ